MSRYRRDEQIGAGTYGTVWRGVQVATDTPVAMKRIKLQEKSEGIPSTAIREISLLNRLDHPNVVKLLDVLQSNSKLTLVFELMDGDLSALIEACNHEVPEAVGKWCLIQLLRAVAYCHKQRVLHRDLKPANLLVSGPLTVKLTDFGLSRSFGGIPVRSISADVVSLYYRAPDVLLGNEQYTTSIDMWSVGCIFAELHTGHPLFQGPVGEDQLHTIVRVLGRPTAEEWPGAEALPGAQHLAEMPDIPRVDLQNLFPEMPAEGIDLLSKMLQYDPEKRITAEEALKHPYLRAMAGEFPVGSEGPTHLLGGDEPPAHCEEAAAAAAAGGQG